jgi:hypothetical protein
MFAMKKYFILMMLLMLYQATASTMVAPEVPPVPSAGSQGSDMATSSTKSRQCLHTIGFRSDEDAELLTDLKNLITDTYDEYDVTLNTPSSPSDLYTLGGGRGIIIINAKKVDFIDDQGIFSYIQSHIDAALSYGNQIAKIFLLVNRSDKVAANTINNFVKEVLSYSDTYSKLSTEVIVVEYSKELAAEITFTAMQTMLPLTAVKAADNKMFQAREEQIKRNQFSADQFHSYIIPSSSESRATIVSSSLVSTFASLLKSKLTKKFPLSRSAELPSPKDLGDILQAVQEEVQQAIPLDLSVNGTDSLLLSSKSFFLGSVQIRLQIHRLLLPFFKESLNELQSTIFKDFQKAVLKIPGSSKGFPGQLYEISKNLASRFAKQATALKQG